MWHRFKAFLSSDDPGAGANAVPIFTKHGEVTVGEDDEIVIESFSIAVSAAGRCKLFFSTDGTLASDLHLIFQGDPMRCAAAGFKPMAGKKGFKLYIVGVDNEELDVMVRGRILIK